MRVIYLIRNLHFPSSLVSILFYRDLIVPVMDIVYNHSFILEIKSKSPHICTPAMCGDSNS